ncbi:MAG: hypothetical protein EOP88_00080 [Verrucomicrobiaceae bacterium]|nr:MAG: hypothetical protein EOP88_00080 [Verrucomicrobiaceae bacterium]
MRIRLFLPAAILLLVPVLTGCGASTSSVAPASSSADTTRWATRRFEISFNLTRAADGKSYSHYTITRDGGVGKGNTLVMTSAHTAGGFASVTDGKPVTEWFRIVEDRSANALLIQEVIPNDHSPCSNYLWVHADPKGNLTGTYLRLPTAPVNDVEYENPMVEILDGEFIEYRYNNGRTIRQPVSGIGKEVTPQKPG